MYWTGVRAVTAASCLLVGALAVIGTIDTRVVAQAPAATPAASRGKAVYDKHCVECHGAAGKGDGAAAHLMTPRPRELTSGKYKVRSTESGSIPTDDDLIRTVNRGLAGTGMPGWQTLLPAEDVVAVVGYIKTLSPRFTSEKPA